MPDSSCLSHSSKKKEKRKKEQRHRETWPYPGQDRLLALTNSAGQTVNTGWVTGLTGVQVRHQHAVYQGQRLIQGKFGRAKYNAGPVIPRGWGSPVLRRLFRSSSLEWTHLCTDSTADSTNRKKKKKKRSGNFPSTSTVTYCVTLSPVGRLSGVRPLPFPSLWFYNCHGKTSLGTIT